MDLEKKYRFYVKFIKFTLWMTGLWPCGTNRTKIIYQRFAAFFCFCTTAMGFAIIYFCWLHSANLDVLMKGVGFLGTIILILVKTVTFIWNRECVSELLDTLDVLSPTELKDPKLRPLLLGLLPALSRYSYLQSVTVAYTIFLHISVPLIIILKQKLSGIVPITYLYPFPGKFPWDVDGVGGILYAVHYLFNLVIGWICFSGVIGPDALFCLFTVQLCGRLRILEYKFRNLSLGNDYDNNFRDCIRRHSFLIRCRDKLQTVYGGIILVQFTSNALVMCALIFQTTEMKTISVGKAMTFVFYFASKFVQALMYSWCGTLLTTESEAVSYAAYDSDWEKLSNPKLMRNVCMVISQRPLTLTACHFTLVNLPMLTTILNTTASYFFLLKAVEEN